VEPDVVVSYAADGGYGHPDHVRAHEATRTAAQVIGVPFYVIASKGRAVVVDDPAAMKRKGAALAAHRTQVQVQGDTYSLSSGGPRALAEPERFDRLRPARAFSSMSLPSRIGSSVLGLVIGAFAGSVLTVAHRATTDVLGLTVPWGIIATVVITTALLAGLRLVFESRVVAACAAVGVLGAILLLSLGSPGGSVLVPDDAVGYVFLIAPVVIAGVVLAWPQDGRWRRGNMGIPAAEGPDQK
jgi:N-acetyl-1-D-myo-inositol-2-amino-2-deoxy-alpha-D-glucopyranoside deacetylase